MSKILRTNSGKAALAAAKEKQAAEAAAAKAKADADAAEARKKREEQGALDRRVAGRASTLLAGEDGGLAPVARKTLLG
jgi:hypothetical protein